MDGWAISSVQACDALAFSVSLVSFSESQSRYVFISGAQV